MVLSFSVNITLAAPTTVRHGNCNYGKRTGLPAESRVAFGEGVSDLVYLTSLLTARVLWATDREPGNEMKDERAPDLNTPGYEPGTQWSEANCSSMRTALSRAWISASWDHYPLDKRNAVARYHYTCKKTMVLSNWFLNLTSPPD